MDTQTATKHEFSLKTWCRTTFFKAIGVNKTPVQQ